MVGRATLDAQARKDLYLLELGENKLRCEDENLPAPHGASGRMCRGTAVLSFPIQCGGAWSGLRERICVEQENISWFHGHHS